MIRTRKENISPATSSEISSDRWVFFLEENVILMGWLILHGINYIPTKYIFQNGPKNVNKNHIEIEGEKDREDIHKKKVRLSSFADCL